MNIYFLIDYILIILFLNFIFPYQLNIIKYIDKGFIHYLGPNIGFILYKFSI